jgi:hypothetical protein
MSKSQSVFFKNKMIIYLYTSHFFHVLSILSDLKSYKCTKLNFTLPFWAVEAKAQYKRAMKQNECVEFLDIFWNCDQIKHWPKFW